MEYLIYLVTNKINCKRYIGQTQQGRLDKRIFEHLIESKTAGTTVIFHNAIRKYGIENFDIEVIEDHIPEEEIDEKEKFYIQFYHTYYKEGKGYNMTLGGQGTHGYIFTKKDKIKMSEKNKAAWKKIKLEQPEKFKQHCEKLRLANLNKKVSLETRKKLS